MQAEPVNREGYILGEVARAEPRDLVAKLQFRDFRASDVES